VGLCAIPRSIGTTGELAKAAIEATSSNGSDRTLAPARDLIRWRNAQIRPLPGFRVQLRVALGYSGRGDARSTLQRSV
jgi:hypothetical protein